MQSHAPQPLVVRILITLVGGVTVALSFFLLTDSLAIFGLTGEFIPTVYLRLGRTLALLTGLDLLAFRFGWRMLAVGALIGIIGPAIGIYLVHREMALIGETLAHTAFAGVAIGLFITVLTGIQTNYLLPALVVAVLGAIIVQYLRDRTHTTGDVPIAIMLSASFALGTVVISLGGGLTGISIESLIFGNVSVIEPTGGLIMLVLSLIVITVIATHYKQFLFITFDEQAARAAQLNVSRYNLILIILTALVVVGSLQILGVILVAAMLVVPVAAATQVAQSFRGMLYTAILIGEFSVIIGILGAHQLSIPAGGTIVLLTVGAYIGAVIATT